jgi:inorganic pyrophosphatase
MDKNYATQFLGKTVRIEIDRPLGTMHPKFKWAYPINYGFVPDTLAPDGEPIDAYVLGLDKPITSFVGTVVAIVHRLNDDDDKLIVISKGQKLTAPQIEAAIEFQEKYFKHKLIFAATLDDQQRQR